MSERAEQLRAEYRELLDDVLAAHLEREILMGDCNSSWASRTVADDRLEKTRAALDAFFERVLSGAQPGDVMSEQGTEPVAGPTITTDTERIYPCDRCGKLRSKAEGGTTFTVCEDCWCETMCKPSGTTCVNCAPTAEPRDPSPESDGTLSDTFESARVAYEAARQSWTADESGPLSRKHAAEIAWYLRNPQMRPAAAKIARLAAMLERYADPTESDGGATRERVIADLRAWENDVAYSLTLDERAELATVIRAAIRLLTLDGRDPSHGEMRENALLVGELLRTQDNRATANPVFVVQQRVRIYGIDPDYTDTFVWCSPGDVEGSSETPVEGWRRVGYVDRWEFVTACLTERGCEEYIAVNGHNLTDPRIYVEGGWRNTEWQFLRKYFAALATPAAPRSLPDDDDAPRCEGCGAPATHVTADDVDLCDRCWQSAAFISRDCADEHHDHCEGCAPPEPIGENDADGN